MSADGARRTGDYRLVPALKVASIFSPSGSAAAGSPSGAVMGTPGSEPHAPHAPKTAPTTLAHSPPGSLQRHPRQYLSTTLTGEIADKVLEAARPVLEAEGAVVSAEGGSSDEYEYEYEYADEEDDSEDGAPHWAPAPAVKGAASLTPSSGAAQRAAIMPTTAP